jgi:hypothetical protein
VTEDGIARSLRGGLTLDASAGGSGDEDFGGGALILAPSIPLTERLFLDVQMPFAFARGFAVGNPLIGVRGVAALSDRFWVVPHGSLGLPLLNEDTQNGDAFLAGPIVHGLWNLNQYSPNTVPLQAGLNVEGHVGDFVILRGQVNFNVLIGYEDNDQAELSIEHAAEVQFGHRYGGGLRLQGVGLPTYEDSEIGFFDGDLYQFAMEPFFAYEGDTLFGRVGILLPLDEVLGPPILQSFAVRMQTGFRID